MRATHRGTRLGSVVPALDSGDFSDVFSRHGNDSSWLFELGQEFRDVPYRPDDLEMGEAPPAAYRITAGSGYPGAGPADPGTASSRAPTAPW